MADLSRESERIARDWLCESQGDQATAPLRYAIRLLLEEAEGKVERLRALELAAVAWVRAEEVMVAELNKHGEGWIPKGSPGDVACGVWDVADKAFRELCREAAEAAGKEE